MRPRLWTAIALATVVVVPTMAQGAMVSGTVKGGKGMKISAIGLDGTATTGTIKSNGSFKLNVPSSRAKNATLHLITKTGDYYGPIVLAKKGTTGYSRLNNKTVNLGAITKKAGYGLVTTTPPKGTYSTKAGTEKVTKAGAPLGAGKLGLVKVASSAAELSVKGEMQSGGGTDPGAGKDPGAGSGGGTGGGTDPGAGKDPGAGSGSGSSGGQQSGSNPTDPCGTALGGDCDRDGIPNAFDVDDNGNLTIDMTDAVSVDTTAKLITMSDVRPSLGLTLNANAGATPESINAFLGSTDAGSPSGLSLAFYYSQYDLLPTGQALTSVWATCGTGAAWCAPGTGTATTSGFGEYPQILPDVAPFGSVAWGTFGGATCSTPGQPCVAASGPSPANGFEQSPENGGGKPSAVWTAFVKPNAPDTLGTVNADSVLTLNYAGQGVPTTQKPIGISPYFVTTPAITNVDTTAGSTALSYPYPANGAGTNQSNGFRVGADGAISLTMWRPQRLSLPGEAGSFFDVGGLHYGLTLDSVSTAANPNGQQRSNGEAGCSLTAGNGLMANNPALSSQWSSLAPLQDQTAIDAPPNAATTVSFSANVLSCAQSTFPGVNLAGASLNLSLLAIAQPLPHGANRTGVSFSVKLAG